MRYVLALLFTAAMALALCAPAMAGEATRAVKVAPDSEKRSVIHEVDGYAYLSEDKTIRELRAEAFANAKRQALEAAESRIESMTRVENFQVDYDVVLSQAEGAVSVIEQKDFGLEPDNRYHVWIKANVEYGLLPKGDPGKAMPSTGPLTVKVWTDKKQYAEGDEITVFIQGNRDFYARVVDVTGDGQVIQLLPNEHRRDNFFKAGVVYQIPDADDAFSLEVVPPFGKDKITVFASEQPLGDAPTRSLGNGMLLYQGSSKDLGSKLRGIRVTAPAKGGNAPAQGAEFYEAAWEFTTGK